MRSRASEPASERRNPPPSTSRPRTNSRCLTEADALKIPGWIKAIGQGQLTALHPFVADLRKDICGLLLGFAAFHEREIRAGVIGLSKALGDLPRKEIRQYGKGRRIAE